MNVEEIIKLLKRRVVAHPKFERTYKSLYNEAALEPPGTVIALLGPTRVGKTTLSRRLAEALFGTAASSGPYRPLIRIEAATTDQGFISTRYLIQQFLQALDHPFQDPHAYSVRTKETEGRMRVRLLQALELRKTTHIIIDEAHHLLRTKSNRSVVAALDMVKCLSNEANCVLILVGGYELVGKIFQSAHLNGRIRIIDFANYGTDDQDVAAFDRLLLTLDEILPWAKGESMFAHRDLMYQGTCGCYGMLIRWTISALSEMAAEDKRVLTKAFFTCTLYTEQIAPIRREIDDGRALLHAIETGGETTPMKRQKKPPKKSQESRRLATRTKRKPFQRRPRRDPVHKRSEGGQ